MTTEVKNTVAVRVKVIKHVIKLQTQMTTSRVEGSVFITANGSAAERNVENQAQV